MHLVLAGGYDPRLQDSVAYLEKLKKIVADEGVADHVTFILSPKDAVKVKLLSICSALIYTPSNEHFGIVPLEVIHKINNNKFNFMFSRRNINFNKNLPNF